MPRRVNEKRSLRQSTDEVCRTGGLQLFQRSWTNNGLRDHHDFKGICPARSSVSGASSFEQLGNCAISHTLLAKVQLMRLHGQGVTAVVQVAEKVCLSEYRNYIYAATRMILRHSQLF